MHKMKELKFSEQKLEDLYGAFKLGHAICKKRHKDSPNYLKSLESLDKKLKRKLGYAIS